MTATRIYQKSEDAEELVGRLEGDGVVYRRRYADAHAIGRVDDALHVYRSTTHGEQEVGHALPTGAIMASGLFEGGPLGWMDPDGVVFRGGLILGEEEMGRVEGPRTLAAAAALLLILIPADEETQRRSSR